MTFRLLIAVLILTMLIVLSVTVLQSLSVAATSQRRNAPGEWIADCYRRCWYNAPPTPIRIAPHSSLSGLLTEGSRR